jgi:hypothetical protein
MTTFFKSGNTYRVAPGDSVDVRDELPGGNYILKLNPMTGFFLEVADGFKTPTKIYGNCLRNCDRIIRTFESRGGNTGVMLVGEKGSGKTLLARQISISSGLPTIIINSDYTGDEFNSFLSAITQPCIVLFDEFEKVYKGRDQEKILTLLDGTYQSKKLFILTSNDKWNLDNNLKNRPGRIFYLIEFDGLGEDFIRQFCGDRLTDQSMTEEIVKTSMLFDKFNFDMLSSFVEEVNRYGEPPSELVSILNAKPEYSGRNYYTASMWIGDTQLPPSALHDNNFMLNPNVDDGSFTVRFCWDGEREDLGEVRSAIGEGHPDGDRVMRWLAEGTIAPGSSDPRWSNCASDFIYVNFEPEDILRYEGSSVFYKTEQGYILKLTKSSRKRAGRND